MKVRLAVYRLPLATVLLAISLGSAAVAQQGEGELRPYRFPDIHGDFVVFSFAGDLWRVATEGGVARRLTAHRGEEIFPRISPDGSQIAFSAEYSGARQVWVMPAAGGEPRQLTFYTDVGPMPPRGGFDYWIQDWTPDGRILVRCNRTPWGQRMGRYCLVDPEGGLETTLPIPHGGSASVSPEGNKLAYTPIDREFRTWKRTRGGRAQDVWIYDLEANRSERITTDRGTDNFPMWSPHGGPQGTIYLTSDREDTLNLYAYDPAGGELRAVTDYEQGDVLWPQLGPDAIVFYRSGRLHRLELPSEEVRPIPVVIDTALPAAVPGFVSVASDAQAATLSPSAQRVVLEARGELWSVPREHGPTRNLTRSPSVRERSPAWSPDGASIAFFDDATGEYELYVRDASGDGAGISTARRLTSGGELAWPSNPVWSPDSERIAWSDSERRLRVVSVAAGADATVRDIDRGTQGFIGSYTFSPDSRFLAYQTWHESSLPGIAVYDLGTDQRHLLGDGLTADFAPAWSSGGDHLFFLSNREYNLRFSSFEFNYLYDRATRVYAAALHAGAPALFPPESDEEESANGEDGAEGSGEDGAGEGDDAPPAVRLEPDGFVARTIAVPGIEPGVYANLVAAEGALFYLFSETAGPGTGPPRLMRYDLEAREAKQVVDRAQAFELSAKGGHLLYAQGPHWAVIEAKPGAEQNAGRLDLSGLRLKIDPRVEWRQMFRDGWRIVRDFFYDPDLHGFDWEALGEDYSALVEGMGSRAELDFVFGEMIAELEAGHAYVSAAGGAPPVERVDGGKLGAELELDPASGRYRFARIFRGENWDAAYRSPLTEPGVEVREGDFLLAIDGEELEADDNPYRLLEGKADDLVTLSVAPAPDGERRHETVRTLESEGNLRYIDWVKEKMELTERLSGGRVGYIHLPDTAIDGNRMLQKLFYGQARKDALIIDDRYNGGGFIPDRMIEVLGRETMSYWARRDVDSTRTPGFAHDGPKVMLMNAYSSSGGDALPYYFRQAGLGKLIGTRTWGGLIGITGAPPLSDGGVVIPPTFRIYDPEGEWVVENEGVEPDIEVFDTPEALAAGADPSIEKGVEILLEELEAGGFGPPERPEPPDLSGPDG